MKWANDYQMSFNTEKCKVLHIGTKNQRYNYKMGPRVLEKTECERDVGVLISHDLTPAQQCSKAAKKAYSVLGRISRAFTFRDKVVWTKLYKTFVWHLLKFANSRWSPSTVADKNLLESMQKRAVMQISNLPGLTYTERLEHLELPTLEERRNRGDVIMVWQLLTHYVDKDHKNCFWFCGPRA